MTDTHWIALWFPKWALPLLPVALGAVFCAGAWYGAWIKDKRLQKRLELWDRIFYFWNTRYMTNDQIRRILEIAAEPQEETNEQ